LASDPNHSPIRTFPALSWETNRDQFTKLSATVTIIIKRKIKKNRGKKPTSNSTEESPNSNVSITFRPNPTINIKKL